MKKVLLFLLLLTSYLFPQISGSTVSLGVPGIHQARNIYGLSFNTTTQVYTRLGLASNKTRTFFDSQLPWRNIKRCNLSDAGIVLAYYGDASYKENGSNGQVMVRIPKFYYRFEETQTGYNWFISPVPSLGYKIHPAFISNGVIKECRYIAAYEGSVYDVSASAYILNDTSGVDFSAITGDKLVSIINAKPASGARNNLTIANARTLAKNRGTGWGLQDYNLTCAIQLLYLIEYGGFNSQTLLSQGVAGITDDAATNMSIKTGYTSTLGNSSGEVSVTHYKTGQITKAMSYRGIENFYGNLWKFVDGLSIQADNKVWIADNAFVSDQFSGSYVNTTLTLPNTNGYPSTIATNAIYDYGFLPKALNGSTSTGLCDYYYQSTGNRIALFGGAWDYGGGAGAFVWYLYYGSGGAYRVIGGRLAF